MIERHEEVIEMTCYCAVRTDIVYVKSIPYKPFFFDSHMYFVNIHSGELFKLTPIYLGSGETADMSSLKSYFRENDIRIVDGAAAVN
ncbi:MAG: hypothetical protein ABRQ27_12280 [Clostridiaceae bacterium]